MIYSDDDEILAVLPGRACDLARLQILGADRTPTVAVIGKYNHGKSRLLNELMGQDAFVVADRRQTVALADVVSKGVRWLDVPGLDADGSEQDDDLARQAAWLSSDIRLFVHAAKEGELDAKELAMLAELNADGERTRRQTLFVLTQVDQLPDDAELDQVLNAIGAQVPGMMLHAVSATRHRQGIEGGKKLLVARSGIPALRQFLDYALNQVPQARAHEADLLLREIREELRRLRAEREAALVRLRQLHREQRRDFEQGLKATISKVGRDLQAVIEVPGPDHALTPDTGRDMYRLTAAKLERARIQIAYSRACIEVEAFLTGQGVIGLPAEQQTVARSLNSVMVAVMGVSVKFRDDLRRMFCETSGQDRLLHDFAHYFELSADRTALAQAIAEAESALAAADLALEAIGTKP